jgi:hypothetical protein
MLFEWYKNLAGRIEPMNIILLARDMRVHRVVVKECGDVQTPLKLGVHLLALVLCTGAQ